MTTNWRCPFFEEVESRDNDRFIEVIEPPDTVRFREEVESRDFTEVTESALGSSGLDFGGFDSLLEDIRAEVSLLELVSGSIIVDDDSCVDCRAEDTIYLSSRGE